MGFRNQFFQILSKMMGALNSRTGKDTVLTFVGQVLTATLGFVFNVLLIRALSVQDYGLFSLFMSSFMLLGGFIHLGWLETFIRFGSKYLDTSVYKKIRNHILFRMLLGSGFLTLIVVVLSPWLSRTVYKRNDFQIFLMVAFFYAFLNNLFSFFQAEYRVKRMFRSYFVLQVGSNFLKLLLVTFLLGYGLLNLEFTVGISVLIPILFMLPSWMVLKKTQLHSPPSDGEAEVQLDSGIKSEISSYNTWLLVSIFTIAIIGNIDSHIIAHYHDNRTLAAFGVAGRMTLPIHFLILSLTATMLPKLSSVKTISEITYYLSLLKLFLIPITAMLVLFCWLMPPLLIWIAGDQYADITLLIRLQILVATVAFLTNPVGLVLYAWGMTKFFAILNLFQMVIHLSLDLILIPRYGGVGAMSSSLLVHIIGLIFIYYSVWKVLRRQGNPQPTLLSH